MAYHKIDKDSINSITNALDFFQIPPTNVSISSSKVFEILPSNPLTDTPYHFKIHSSQNYVDLSKCYLFTEFRIRKEDANGLLVNLVATDNVAPIQLIGHTFINNMRISINGREVFNSNSLMAYKSYLSHELSFSTGAKSSHLSVAGQYGDKGLSLESGDGYTARNIVCLTTNDVGEPNLDFTRHALERSKRRKESNSSKNVHYNQELRRYLQLRNERENRPVKVEVVNKSKGVIIPKTNSRPATYISSAANDNDGNDDDYWISDNLSFSSYPREAPNDAYNIVPPLSSSSNPSSIPIELDPRPSTSSQVLKRNVKDNGDEESKRFKINKEIKKKGKPKKKINKKQKVTIEHGSVIASQNAPLSPSPPLPQDVQ
uniref:EAF domain-containing protein n=1 Tax=Meloidogyne hapla TaxID=6305 RepID=A0A1I8BM19_MELHA